jgi:mannosyltransferase
MAVLLWGISGPSYWRDEAATLSATSRSLPQLWQLLDRVDAVHGLYYLIMWPVIRLFGASELVTRLPSALAMAAAALGVAAIGRRLHSDRVGLLAGLVFAALPEVSVQGHDARPYAMVTASAVLASYLLIRAIEQPGPGRFAAYGAALAGLGYLHLFGLLLIPAHAITLTMPRSRRPGSGASGALLARSGLAGSGLAGSGLAGSGLAGSGLAGSGLAGSGAGPLDETRQRQLRGWLAAVAGACCAVTPLTVVAWHQRVQISWIVRPGWGAIYQLLQGLAAGSAVSVIVIALLCVLGATRDRGGSTADGSRPLAWLAVPWLLVPPALLLTVSQLKPVYYLIYVTFCLPAVALLAGAALAQLGKATLAGALAVLAVVALPTQLAVRQPDAFGELHLVAQVVRAAERPGDGVIYPGSGLPSWTAACPEVFNRLRDVGLGKPAAEAGRLDGNAAAPRLVRQRLAGIQRLWVIAMHDSFGRHASVPLSGFQRVKLWRVFEFTIELFRRTPPPGPGSGRSSVGVLRGKRFTPLPGAPLATTHVAW